MNLVSNKTTPPTDLVARWRAWKSGKEAYGPFSRDHYEMTSTYHYLVTEADLTWMMLEIERLRAAIEGLVDMDGGRH